MADEALLDKVQDLSDLELAVLTCLVAREHCVIDTEPHALDQLVLELQLAVSEIFGLSSCVVDCTSQTSLDDLADSIFPPGVAPRRTESPLRRRQDSQFLQSPSARPPPKSPAADSYAGGTRMANVIIAKNLDEAPKEVQIQVLELIRNKRIFTHTSMQLAPKPFLVIAAIAGGEGPRLTGHLNDHMFISHFHDPEEDGFPNLQNIEDDAASISSVVRGKASEGEIKPNAEPLISAADIETLMKQAEGVPISPEMNQYMHHIIVFLRMHRAVQGGISPSATTYFSRLIQCLAALHGLTYITPTLIALGAKKIYPHRIQIVAPAKERSMQWGSSLEAVTAALKGVGPEVVVEEVLGMVEVPT